MSKVYPAGFMVLLKPNFPLEPVQISLGKLNHFLLALSASFHICHRVAAFPQRCRCQHLKLEGSGDRAQSGNQETTNTGLMKRGKVPKL